MRAALALIAACAVSGCAIAPDVTSASPQAVTIRQDPVLHSDAAVEEHAEQACRQYGKAARYRFTTVPGIGFPGAPVSKTFDCI